MFLTFPFLFSLSCSEKVRKKCCTQIKMSDLIKKFNSSEDSSAYIIQLRGNRLEKLFKEDSLIVESYRLNDQNTVEFYNFYNYNGDKNSIIGLEWNERGCINMLGGYAMKLAELNDKVNTDTLEYMIYAPQIIGYKTELLFYEKVGLSVDTTIIAPINSPETTLLLPKEDFADNTDSIFIEVKILSNCSNDILSRTVHGFEFYR